MCIPDKEQIYKNLVEATNSAKDAKSAGHHPFGAVLVAPDNETVLLRQGNINTVNHAESTLCRIAFDKFTPEYLWGCTLYTNFEPCAMCAGTIYWANIGRVVYGLSESALLEQTLDNSENMTMSLECRIVLGSGQKKIEVIGPVDSWAGDEWSLLKRDILQDHIDFWQQTT